MNESINAIFGDAYNIFLMVMAANKDGRVIVDSKGFERIEFIIPNIDAVRNMVLTETKKNNYFDGGVNGCFKR